MENSPSIVVCSSPKLITDTKEEKVNCFQKCVTINQAHLTPSIFQKIVAEFIGTYFLIFLGCGAILVNKVQPLTIVGIAIVWGLVLAASIYAVGHISGAHFNPAVTIAFAASQKLPWIHVPIYVMTQLLSATLASLTLWALFSDLHGVSAIANGYSSPTTNLQAFTWEFIATFVLMFTICAVATDHRASKDLAGVAIGAALLANVMVVGPITGASLNPARSFGPAIVTGTYSHLWLFIIAPVLGATCASTMYRFLRVPELEKLECTKAKFDHQAEP